MVVVCRRVVCCPMWSMLGLQVHGLIQWLHCIAGIVIQSFSFTLLENWVDLHETTIDQMSFEDVII